MKPLSGTLSVTVLGPQRDSDYNVDVCVISCGSDWNPSVLRCLDDDEATKRSWILFAGLTAFTAKLMPSKDGHKGEVFSLSSLEWYQSGDAMPAQR